MQQTELDALMVQTANDATTIAKDEFGKDLDFSAASIDAVDDILLAFIDKYHDKALEDSAVFTICNVFGAYIGETFKRAAGGTWRYDQTDPQAPFVVLDYGDKSYAFAGICYERLVNDSQVSTRLYFESALENHRQ